MFIIVYSNVLILSYRVRYKIIDKVLYGNSLYISIFKGLLIFIPTCTMFY